MKTLYITVCMLCAAAFVACNNDKDEAPQPNNSDEITISAGVGRMSANKALKLGTSFDFGDEISVYAWTGSYTSGTSEMQVDNAINTLGFDGSWTANPKMKWKNAQSKHYFIGIYPQKALTDFSADAYTLNTADQEASDVLVATNLEGLTYSSGAVPLTFSHIMARIDVNIKLVDFGATPTTVTAKLNAKTAATINYLKKAVTAQGNASEIALPATAAADGYMFSFSSIMIPQNSLNEISLIIDGETYTYTHSSDITLKGGCYTTVNLSIKHCDEIAQGNVDITDWDNGEEINGEINSGKKELTELGKTFEPVDLGLPSGLKWASWNIGATAIADYTCEYYSWGELRTKAVYNWSSYKYSKGTRITQTKYCHNSSYGYNGYTDNLTTLELSDDVANVKLGGKWRIPTHEDWLELYNNCEHQSCLIDGVSGFKLTGPNGAFIFLPAAGDYNDANSYSGLNSFGSEGHYWSSSLNEEGPCDAWSVYFAGTDFNPSFYDQSDNHDRFNGYAIRPVYAGDVYEPTPITKPTAALTELGKTFEPVDLGLPSGLKWASWNIGAKTMYEYGLYYSWGEIETKTEYLHSNYKFGNYDEDGLTKYNNDKNHGYNGFTDNLTTLELSDDVANVKLGGNWRIPTQEEWQELYDNCERQWCADGYKMIGPNGNYIFLPAADHSGGGRIGLDGRYWSSSLRNDLSHSALCIYFHSGSFDSWSSGVRADGFTVRPVYSGEVYEPQ